MGIIDTKNTINEMHSGDKEQLEAIYSVSNRLLIEAPAGYGKTRTIISKVAYALTKKENENHKKFLILSFSVNSASKIREDVKEQIPKLLTKEKKKLIISNYHGICRSILKKYGYLLNNNFNSIQDMISIEENQTELTELVENANNGVKLTNYEKELLISFNECLKKSSNINGKFIKKNYKEYIEIVLNKLIPNFYIPYNSFLILTIYLFREYKEIKKFYKNYFQMIIVDEFQDTNFLSFFFLSQLVSNDNQLMLVGDPLQRIYGFIGAMPNLMQICKRKYDMKEITLLNNYRFQSNSQMSQLEKIIRHNAEEFLQPDEVRETSIPLLLARDQNSEVDEIINKIISLKEHESETRLVVLARQKFNNRNLDILIEELKNREVPFFYALYSEQDDEYINFHKECKNLLTFFLSDSPSITKRFTDNFLSEIKKLYSLNESNTINSLIVLLGIFLKRLKSDYRHMNNEQKIELLIETFSNYTLKNHLEYVEEKLVISTIHASKGLEWDYVFLPDMEQFVFPSAQGFCAECAIHSKLNITSGLNCVPDVERFNEDHKKVYLEELSVFYVAVTRAKKKVFFSASRKRINGEGKIKFAKLSCFLNLSGISHESF
ncbi:ATP-dependent helicase [Marinococcus sp. PL1-022]|uniref:ATP-dependent helicase n=1 Tax=Marinococcus sp. PL1-022 TaxID=3095363 RepID=UPI0029C56FA7|nr:ATP-dependent helicase [Marinococcus sp. PL1-022]MDX6152001.1 ATP-dependent helicase [Marinococcus sp. PL1-022]